MVRHSPYPGNLPDGSFCFRTFTPPPHAACKARHPTEDLDVHGRWDRQLVVQRAPRVEEDIDVRTARRAADRSSHTTPLLVHSERLSCVDRANLLARRSHREGLPSSVRVRNPTCSARFFAVPSKAARTCLMDAHPIQTLRSGATRSRPCAVGIAAPPAAIVDTVVAVPSRSAAGAHLREPRPYLVPGARNGDRVGQRSDRFRNQLVAWKVTRSFETGRPDRSVEHLHANRVSTRDASGSRARG
jgi:hypothetical protein